MQTRFGAGGKPTWTQYSNLISRFDQLLAVTVLIWFVGGAQASDAGRRVLSVQKARDPSGANFAARSARWLGQIIVLVGVLNVLAPIQTVSQR